MKDQGVEQPNKCEPALHCGPYFMFSKRDNNSVQIKVFVGYKIVIMSGTFCLAINSCYHSFFNYKIEQIPIRTIQEMFKLIYL